MGTKYLVLMAVAVHYLKVSEHRHLDMKSLGYHLRRFRASSNWKRSMDIILIDGWP